jgi:TolB-like protein
MSLFAELKRRNVVRVGIAYAVIGWILAQIAEFAFENFGAPDWVLKSFVVVLLLGLPLALFFAWAFEITPEGVKREKDVDRSKSITHSTGRKLDFVIMGTLVLALGYFVWERQTYDRDPLSGGDAVSQQAEDDSITADESASTDVAGPKIAESEKRSIAVLPFINMSSDQEQEWFADGLTEEILNSLAKTPDLLVTARTTSFGYKGSTDPVPQIAAALGVDHVLEGSVRRGGDKFRITAQLIRAADGFHLWSETYDRPMQDIIATQEEIAIQIANALETALDPEALANMMDAGTSSVAAYEAYLTGLGALRAADASGDPYESLDAMESFNHAVDVDPEFAKAYGYISLFWALQLQSNQMYYGVTDEPLEVRKARRDEALENAIRYEKDPVQKLVYEAAQARDQFDFRRALRLRQESFDARPTSDFGISGLFVAYRELGLNREVTDLIKTIYANYEFTERLASQGSQSIRIIEESEFMREFAQAAVEKYGNNASLLYQAHRQLLWAGDIDGASSLVARLENSGLQETSRLLVSLRQACAEGKITNANKIHARILEKYPDDTSIMWLAYKIIGDDESAAQMFVEYDEQKDFDRISDYVLYAHFDPRLYPNFMQAVAGQGFEKREVLELPYRCNR